MTLLAVTRGNTVTFDLAGAESVLHVLRAHLDDERAGRLRWSAAGDVVTR